MNQVWAFEDRVNEGILSDTDLGKLGIAPACIAPGECASSHSHTLVEEINIIRSGTGTLQIEDEIHDVCAGSVGVIPAGKFHELKNTGSENLEFIAVFNSDADPKDIVFLEKEAHFAAKDAAKDRPGYIKMLGDIAAGEARGAVAFKCWAQTTEHEAFATTLNIIAIREAEHASAFEKRLCELGYPCEGELSADFVSLMEMFESDASDIEKLECFGAHKPVFDDPFDDVFKDKTIDAQTGALLGRFIAEERSSIAMLQDCYKLLSGNAATAAKSNGAAAVDDVSLADICAAVTSLTGMVAALQSDVSALKAPEPKAMARKAAAKKANGRAKTR